MGPLRLFIGIPCNKCNQVTAPGSLQEFAPPLCPSPPHFPSAGCCGIRHTKQHAKPLAISRRAAHQDWRTWVGSSYGPVAVEHEGHADGRGAVVLALRIIFLLLTGLSHFSHE